MSPNMPSAIPPMPTQATYTGTPSTSDPLASIQAAYATIGAETPSAPAEPAQGPIGITQPAQNTDADFETYRRAGLPDSVVQRLTEDERSAILRAQGKIQRDFGSAYSELDRLRRAQESGLSYSETAERIPQVQERGLTPETPSGTPSATLLGSANAFIDALPDSDTFSMEQRSAMRDAFAQGIQAAVQPVMGDLNTAKAANSDVLEYITRGNLRERFPQVGDDASWAQLRQDAIQRVAIAPGHSPLAKLQHAFNEAATLRYGHEAAALDEARSALESGRKDLGQPITDSRRDPSDVAGGSMDDQALLRRIEREMAEGAASEVPWAPQGY